MSQPMPRRPGAFNCFSDENYLQKIDSDRQNAQDLLKCLADYMPTSSDLKRAEREVERQIEVLIKKTDANQ